MTFWRFQSPYYKASRWPPHPRSTSCILGEHTHTLCTHKLPWAPFPSLVSAVWNTPVVSPNYRCFLWQHWKRLRLTSETWMKSRDPQLWGLLKPWDRARSRIYCCRDSFWRISSIFLHVQLWVLSYLPSMMATSISPGLWNYSICC